MSDKEESRLAPGQVEAAPGLVDYQEGSIVSRTLIGKEVGTVSVFAFSRGEGLSEHTAPYDALIHVLEGEAGISIGGQSMPVQAGQMVLLPANVPHAVQAPGDFKMMLTMIKA